MGDVRRQQKTQKTERMIREIMAIKIQSVCIHIPQNVPHPLYQPSLFYCRGKA